MKLALVAALAAVGAGAAAAAVERGTVTPNSGAAGIIVGMTRAQVVARLGKPLYENRNGYMQYAKQNLFDVYLDLATKRVRLIGVSGPRFCVGGDICMMRKGNVGALRARYGKAFKAITDDDGSPAYAMYGRLGGRRVFTTLAVARHPLTEQVFQIFVGYCRGACPGA